MRKILINFADANYRKAQSLCSWTGKHIAGFDEVIEYGPADVDEAFRQAHRDIFSYQRGCGLWLWKPYLLLKTLEQCSQGDIVFYCDAGACFFRKAQPVFDILEHSDIWLSVLPLLEKQFTKAEAFEILEATSPPFTDTPQISGTFLAFKKTAFSVDFVKEWLSCCCILQALAPPQDTGREIATFYAHREDQSILSLLSKKHGIRAYSDPSQYGRLPEKYIRKNCTMHYYGKEDYRPFLLHHRKKQADAKVLLHQWLCAALPRRLGLKLIRQAEHGDSERSVSG